MVAACFAKGDRIIDKVILNERLHGKIVILTIQGSLIAGNLRELSQVFQKYKTRGVVWFVFDLTNVRVMQSLIIGAVLSLYKNVHAEGGGVLLINPSDQVRYVLELARVSQLISEYENVDDALASILTRQS